MTAEPIPYPLEPADAEAIKSWAKANPDPMTLVLSQTDHAEQKTFDAFALALAGLAPQITMEQGENAPLPGFKISPTLDYCALPLGRELAPFLKTLELRHTQGTQKASTEIPPELDQLDRPCRLDLYIALQCPHCPAMVETLAPLALASDNIRLSIIDGSLFPEEARRDNVMAAPCLILDKDFRWTGTVPAREIIAMAAQRDPSQLSSQSLRQILEQGDADWIAREMTLANRIFPAFMDLLLHPTWSVRLGAMVVVEALAQEAPDLIDGICPGLMAAFEEADITLKGDILYALGEAGGPQTQAWIESIRPELEHPDLVEAAQDALDTLADKMK
ncbi:MAG: thioredoxin family protein [Desulfobacterales bacterium]|nr:thioredoxin family protein [Desulfobacterales bacterium]